MISPEKLGEMVAKEIIGSKEFKEKVEALFMQIDGVIRDAANDLRNDAEAKLKIINFSATDEGEELEMEYGMTAEGDIARALAVALSKELEDL